MSHAITMFASLMPGLNHTFIMWQFAIPPRIAQDALTHRAKLMCLVLLSQHLVKLRELLFCAGAIPIPALLQYNHDVIKSTTQGASQNSLAKSLDVLQCDGIKHSIKTTAARVKGTQSRGKEHICNHIVSFSHHRNKIDPHYPSFLLASTPVCNKHKRLQTTSVILPTAFFI